MQTFNLRKIFFGAITNKNVPLKKTVSRKSSYVYLEIREVNILPHSI